MLDITLENTFEDKNYLIEKKEIEGDIDDDDIDITQNEVISFIGNFSLAEYASKLKSGIIKRPNFQRNEVWSNKQKSKLIESFLASYPVPPVILYKEKGKEQYLIIDGFQRITAISDYYNNEFKLIINNEKYKNKTYDKLPIEAREKLNNAFLNCTIVHEIAPQERSKKFLYNLFERLNTGGKALNAMETRRAISYGKLIKELEELNLNKYWREIYGKKEPDARFLDIELLLRLLVFYKNYDINNNSLVGYSAMRSFLDEYISEHSEDSLGDFVSVFEKAVLLVFKTLGKNPFALNSVRPNYLILDSIMTAVLLLNSNVENLKKKFVYILESQKEYFNNKSGTQRKSRIEERIKFAVEGLR